MNTFALALAVDTSGRESIFQYRNARAAAKMAMGMKPMLMEETIMKPRTKKMNIQLPTMLNLSSMAMPTAGRTPPRRPSACRTFCGTTASVLWGILVGMEEQKALGKPVSDEMIRTVKSSLMGPLAGVGDSLVQATILPLLTTIAISLTGAGDVLSPLGVVLFIIATPILLWAYARVLFNNGYTLGKDAVSTLMGSAMDRIKTAVQLFGIIVIGALSASYVKLSTPLSFAASADATPVVLQDVINGIFPNLLSLLLVLGCWYLLSKKGVSVTKAIFGLMGIVVVLGLIGIL